MKLVVIGGCTEGEERGCLRSAEVLDVADFERDEARFELMDNVLAEPRRGAAGFVRGGQLILAGGCAGPKRHLSSCESIQFNNNRLESKQMSYTVAESSCSAFCQIDDRLLIAGGFDGYSCLNGCSLNNFTTAPTEFGLISRLKNAAAVADPWNEAQALLIGGWDESRTLNAVFSLDLDANSSNVARVLPYPIEGHTATLVQAPEIENSSIFVAGGFDGLTVVDTITRIHKHGCEILDIKLEQARENHSGVHLKSLGQLWIIGGWDGKQALDTVERFRTTSAGDKTCLERLPTIRLNGKRQKAVVGLINVKNNEQ